ncbi:MAG TPA: RNA polymerase sigma factor SigJ [Solirubrobacterales bacterium]|jgi:RNA polymerase sigma-70 factor (ECF subfamily)|nr:RNA polymerase sigma factor SigJ [Solirubrobacterales bacterium]
MDKDRDTRSEGAGQDLVAAFEALRPQLTRVAYGILGSLAEAEDVVQEAWLRLGRVDPAEIEDLRAWLTTVVGRLALDALGTARRRRESYVGEWLPEPLVEEDGDDPTLDESVSTALLVVLERLSPAERTAFLLHDVFDLPFDKVAAVVGRSPAAVRQLASRARTHVEAGKPRFPADADEEARIVAAFATAWQEGDHEALLGLLDPEAIMRSDGGGQVPSAGKPLLGADRIARALAAFTRSADRRGEEPRGRFARVNGAAGLVVHDRHSTSVVSLTIDAGRIAAVDIVRNPDKLRGLMEAD